MSFTRIRALLELTDKYDVPLLVPTLAIAALHKASEQPMEAWAILIIHGQREAARSCLVYMDQEPSKNQAKKVDGRYSWHRWTPAFIPKDLLSKVPAAELQKLLILNDNVMYGAVARSWAEAASRF